MITLNKNNLLNIQKEHGSTAEELESFQDRLPQYLEQIKEKNLGFYTVIDDIDGAAEIENYAREQKEKFESIVVVGIGGSALGTICLRDALTSLYKKQTETPELYVLDNIDPTMIHELEEVITYEKTLFIVISKSGTTPEILSQFLYFEEELRKRNLATHEHMVFVTDPEQGFLREVAEKNNIKTFPIPKNVGGRFSVLTAVGLLPAALIGIDIQALLKGAQTMRDQFLSIQAEENISFQLATIQYILHKKKKSMCVLMPYAQKLTRFADWYRQLLAESIGKARDNNNKIVNVGITPVKALGATDQHSQSQLYNEGPNDKYIIFLTVKRLADDIAIPNTYEDDSRTAFLRGVTINDLLKSEYEATADSYTENNRPNMTIEIEQIDEHTLGSLFLLFEGSIAFLGEYFNINAFDQPGVERAKQLTKEYVQK